MRPTELYLVRHGLAGVANPDRDDRLRPLTPEGRRRTRAVARRLQALGLRFDGLLSSPLVRARQTAELLQRVGLSKRLEESELLAPGGDFREWLRWLRAWRHGPGHRRLALVGHMPALGDWAETLLCGQVQHWLLLKKAGVLGLTLPERGSPIGRCTLFLLSAPKYLLE
jgi:phosphohistidine phosphatase